jgi:hypothetical protein
VQQTQAESNIDREAGILSLLSLLCLRTKREGAGAAWRGEFAEISRQQWDVFVFLLSLSSDSHDEPAQSFVPREAFDEVVCIDVICVLPADVRLTIYALRIQRISIYARGKVCSNRGSRVHRIAD